MSTEDSTPFYKSDHCSLFTDHCSLFTDHCSLFTDHDPWAMLRGYEPLSLCDWPGKVTAVLFFGGCNLRCPTCHNARLAWEPQSLPPLDAGEVLKKIDQDKTWLDGLVITGGEPTILPGLEQILSRLKEFDLPLKLDTNGLRPDVVKLVLEKDLARVIAVDVKGPWDKYPQLTGNKVSSQKAQECLEAIFDMAIKYPHCFMFRCTKVPDLTEDDLQIVRSYLPQGFSLKEQAYIEPNI